MDNGKTNMPKPDAPRIESRTRPCLVNGPQMSGRPRAHLGYFSIRLLHCDPTMGWTDYLPASWLSTAWMDRFRPAYLTRRLSKDLFIALSLSSTSAALYLQQFRRKKAIQRIPPRPIELRSEEIGDGVIGLIGGFLQGQAVRPMSKRALMKQAIPR